MKPANAALLTGAGVLLLSQVVLGDLVNRLTGGEEFGVVSRIANDIRASLGQRPGNKSALKFVRLLLSQRGDTYVFGGETSGEKDPNGYDCSEFIQWAMNRLGFSNFPDGSAAQIAHATPIPVANALKIRGAVLYFPGHIAVSLGNGKSIEARGSAYGVGVFSASNRGWTKGGLLPELNYTALFKKAS